MASRNCPEESRLYRKDAGIIREDLESVCNLYYEIEIVKKEK
jgi:hypothetical protein